MVARCASLVSTPQASGRLASSRSESLHGDTLKSIATMATPSDASRQRGASIVLAAVAAAAPAAEVQAQVQRARQMEALPLSQLRAMARAKGIVGGGGKAELVASLLGASAGAGSAAPAAAAAPVVEARAAPVAAAAVEASAPAPAPADVSPLDRQLQSKSLSALRAMARQKGIRGQTKDELVAALLAASSSLPSAASPSSSAAGFSPPAVSPSSAAAPIRAAAAAKSGPATILAELPTEAPFTLPFQSDLPPSSSSSSLEEFDRMGVERAEERRLRVGTVHRDAPSREEKYVLGRRRRGGVPLAIFLRGREFRSWRIVVPRARRRRPLPLRI